MSATTKKLAILFADISGSTALYEKLGDQLARQLIARCISILNKALVAHNGTLIKTIGDEILCTFPSAEIALGAACEMQQAIKVDNQSSEQAMYIRIGFHYGDVICEEGDIFGDAVNVAARVTAITRASQIMTTTAAVDAIPLSQHDKIRKILRTDVKGKQHQIDIYQVMWALEDMNSTRIGIPAFRKPKTDNGELHLTYKNQIFKMNEQSKEFCLGRDGTCEICVNSDFASRQHASVKYSFGKFILSDHSSNGTYIRSSDDIVTRLSREETVLHGNGSISLGQPYSDQPLDLIKFEIKEKL